MPPSYSAVPPSSPSRRLAIELRRLREETGLSGDGVAARLKWSPSKISRYECARTGLKPSEVQKLLALYQVPPDKAELLMALAERGWAERRDEAADRFWAAEVRAWAPLSVPLLLRTEDYHAEVLRALGRISPVSPGVVRDAVNRNILWQARLLTTENPLRLRVVLAESVLCSKFGDRSVMLGQIYRLMSLAEQSQVDMWVLPLGSGGLSWLPAFTHTTFLSAEEGEPAPDEAEPAPDEAEVTTLTGAWQPESERDTWLHRLAFEQLAEAAEPADDYLKKALAEWSAEVSGG